MTVIRYNHHSISLGDNLSTRGTIVFDVTGVSDEKAHTDLTFDAAKQVVNHLNKVFEFDQAGKYLARVGWKPAQREEGITVEAQSFQDAAAKRVNMLAHPQGYSDILVKRVTDGAEKKYTISPPPLVEFDRFTLSEA
jgi:hypothetical protein